MKKKYFTNEERLAANRASSAKRYQKHRDEILAKKAEWRKNNKEREREITKRSYEKNREEILAKKAENLSTPIGRAKNLLKGYRRADKDKNRGECTLTVEFILEHIFTQPCAHCGCSDWRQIGCNRLDNNLPHTPDNVEPCCWECNDRLGREDFKKTVYQYTLDGLLVAIWSSTNECGRNGYTHQSVSACCNGKRKSHKGYRWSYEPL